jgi:hypothetical protein
LTLSIKQKVHHGKVEQRLKTANGYRQVDLHPAIAELLKQFVDNRKAGFLFPTRKRKPVSPTNIMRRHCPTSAQMGQFETAKEATPRNLQFTRKRE